jgi:hypothetical protein
MDSTGSEREPVVGSCEYNNAPLASGVMELVIYKESPSTLHMLSYCIHQLSS